MKCVLSLHPGGQETQQPKTPVPTQRECVPTRLSSREIHSHGEPLFCLAACEHVSHTP